ncbi:yjeF C-terminal region, hydroxyethylthiazole kinase-related/yjeF N-terminal region [Oryzisolibacter propanilivorax]|uniref:Bifunctional NAD(P)H-hydrate repair enzyme n=1 Tax=Oryzisolibacter propanilivorax TaxID=1527607 RepID=A0A1G9SQH8_9BURK|nr:NAD(P)H-hydrate dehydratase [Oryzisolibacter propanilivorax]SDM37683.1 yjeF C-terminal region, hydroxyethylthiazole kinase-related/yjeF N-terminal region [Oryzisolibacter propanilivorax]
MQRITPDLRQPLFRTQSTRTVEAEAAARLPPHTLMQRAGAATARLARALAPHARQVWLACGAGNNGGDGLEAAALLQAAGLPVAVTCLTDDPSQLPTDARASWQRARNAGVRFVGQPPALGAQDLAVDALLGLGLTAAARPVPPDSRLLACLAALRGSAATVLHVDLPSGLLADTGQYAPGLEPDAPPGRGARHTLALLTLKPGLFTALGRDAAGDIWLDTLGAAPPTAGPDAWLAGRPDTPPRPHASHKGRFGDVAVVGGEALAQRGMGMTGAALLAASAALHAGAGRVLISLLGDAADADPALALQPECMPRHFDALPLDRATLVAGCGGGTAIAGVLPVLLQQAPRLVLDADALNAIAGEARLQRLLAARASQADWATVLTPHPLEAARLLQCSTEAVQADRLAAAQALAERLACTVVLKGSGSVVAAPERVPLVNPTGNARLATAGTGDVLAGLLGARLAALPPATAFDAAAGACWQHGQVADDWPQERACTALALARALTPDAARTV